MTFDFMPLVRAFTAEPIILSVLAVAAVLCIIAVTLVGSVHVLAMVYGDDWLRSRLDGSYLRTMRFEERYDRETFDSDYREWKKGRD